MASKASAVWTGSLKEGKGTISTATGVLKDANYSFATRFEGAATGTTPEELIAAAHASCFSMALGAQLGGAGLTPDKIETHAAVTLAKVGDGFSITKIALTTTPVFPAPPRKSSTRLLPMQRPAARSQSSLQTTPRSRSTQSWSSCFVRAVRRTTHSAHAFFRIPSSPPAEMGFLLLALCKVACNRGSSMGE